jgi:molecular chaperone GrpE (heat shock protein)
MRSLAQLLREADSEIEKLASPKVSAPSIEAAEEEDDIVKLAFEVMNQEELTEENFTEAEKIAMSLAVTETLLSADQLQRLIALEKKASEQGVPTEQINEFFAKVAQSNTVGQNVFHLLSDIEQRFERVSKCLGV